MSILGSKNKTMRALVKTRPEVGIWMEQVPVPQIGPNDVLIRIRKTAICGTDLHIYKWDPWVIVHAFNALNRFTPIDVQANVASPAFGTFYNSEVRRFVLQFRFAR